MMAAKTRMSRDKTHTLDYGKPFSTESGRKYQEIWPEYFDVSIETNHHCTKEISIQVDD